jgi:hypothetical protein
MEAAIEEAVRVLWTIFYTGQTSRFETEGLQSFGMQEETETGCAKAMAGKERRILPGPIRRRESLAKTEKGNLWRLDDTRRDTLLKANTAVCSADPGGQDGYDTRQDRLAEA